jgi:hypothetical protein
MARSPAHTAAGLHGQCNQYGLQLIQCCDLPTVYSPWMDVRHNNSLSCGGWLERIRTWLLSEQSACPVQRRRSNPNNTCNCMGCMQLAHGKGAASQARPVDPEWALVTWRKCKPAKTYRSGSRSPQVPQVLVAVASRPPKATIIHPHEPHGAGLHLCHRHDLGSVVSSAP